MLPYILLSIPAGVIADRFDRRLVLLSSDLARAACMVVLAGLVAAAGRCGRSARSRSSPPASRRSSTRRSAPWSRASSATSASSGPRTRAWATLDNLAWIVGPGIAGLLLATGDLAARVRAQRRLVHAHRGDPVDAAARAGRQPRAPAGDAADPAGDPRRPTPTPSRGDAGVDATSSSAGTPGLDRASGVAGVVLIDPLTWFAFGGIGILIVVIATDVFHGGDAATGYLNVALGVGGTIGAVLSAALVLRPQLGPVLLAGAPAFGAATVVARHREPVRDRLPRHRGDLGRQPHPRRHPHDDLPARVPDAYPRPARRPDADDRSPSPSPPGTLVIPILVTRVRVRDRHGRWRASPSSSATVGPSR